MRWHPPITWSWRRSSPCASATSPAPTATSTTRFLSRSRIDEMLRRIDHLARLGTSIITISGGEPLTHPDLDQIIARIRHHGRLAGMITNGYFLMPDRIERLNQAGLDHMQISIDNVQPDEISKKSLKVLDKKLQFLVRVRRVSRQHQLRRRRRHQEPAGRAHHRPSRARARASPRPSASSTMAAAS